MHPFPDLEEKVLKCWKSEGSLVFNLFRYQEYELYQLCIHPSVREVYGGKKDGLHIYPKFEFNMKKFIKIFDKVKNIRFISKEIYAVVFRGVLEGKEIEVLILSSPPVDAEVNEIAYFCGPKSGTVELKGDF